MTPSGITLATVTPLPKEPFWTTPEQDGTITQAIYTYGPNQHTRRRWFPWLNDGKGDKKVMPYSRADENSDWKNKAGDDPWPLFTPVPIEGFEDHWVLEVEGEKCARILAEHGFVAISQPGCKHSLWLIADRYDDLYGKVRGVIYLADNDREGTKKALLCRDAAESRELDFIHVDMAEVFPDLPLKGSIDNVPDVPAAVQQILDSLPSQQPSQENCAEPARPATPADPEDPPAEAPLRKVDPEARAAFTFDDLLPPDLADAAALLSEAWPTDPLTVSLTYLAAISGALPIGSRVAASATFDVPMNLYLGIVADSGSSKSPLYREFVKKPFGNILAAEKEAHRIALSYWRNQNPKERGDKPARMHAQLNDWNNSAALDLELERHADARAGILLCADELISPLNSVAADTQRGSGRGESQVLSLFDGDGNSSTRATRDGGSYDESHVSIVGGIQPSVLKDLIKGDDRTGKWARFLWVQYPPGIIIPADDDPTELQLRRFAEARDTLKRYADLFHSLEPGTVDLEREGRVMFNRWFVDHQTRAVAIGDNVITPMLKKSSAQALRLGGLLYRVRQPGGLIVDPERVQQAMSIVDCVFAETERFHQGDGDLIDQLMDRIRGLRGEVTWELLRAKHLNRWLKANAKARHFSEAVSNLIANDEGELVKTKPLTWRR